MDVIKEILINYWKIIVAAFILLISFILRLIQKKPVKIVDGSESSLFRSCLKAICVTEDLSKKTAMSPKDKLDNAVLLVLNDMRANFPELDPNSYLNSAVKLIEAILSTPQKHEIDK